MNASEIKFRHEQNHKDSYFFCRDTMKVFGDTMANFGCFDAGIIQNSMGEKIDCWCIYRKRKVKGGQSGRFYFDKVKFDYVGTKDYTAEKAD